MEEPLADALALDPEEEVDFFVLLDVDLTAFEDLDEAFFETGRLKNNGTIKMMHLVGSNDNCSPFRWRYYYSWKSLACPSYYALQPAFDRPLRRCLPHLLPLAMM